MKATDVVKGWMERGAGDVGGVAGCDFVDNQASWMGSGDAKGGLSLGVEPSNRSDIILQEFAIELRNRFTFEERLDEDESALWGPAAAGTGDGMAAGHRFNCPALAAEKDGA